MLRVDLRAYDHGWGTRAFTALRAPGRELSPVWSGDQPVDPRDFAFALRQSPAWRFVEEPEAFLRRVSIGGYGDA